MFLPSPPPPLAPRGKTTQPSDCNTVLFRAYRRRTIHGPIVAPTPLSSQFSAFSPPIFVPPPKPAQRHLLIESFKKKPYTAVTVQIERLTSETYDENDFSGIPELIESIRLQDSGPTEASRAIRKKLKYGSVHRQLRALTILDALIGNAGKTFQRSFADEPLLERLRIAATDPMSDPEVRAKCKILFGQWALNYKDTQGLSAIASLYRQLPQRRRPRPQPRDTSPDGASSPPPSTARRGSIPTSNTNNNGSSSRSPKSSQPYGNTTTIMSTSKNAKGPKKNKLQAPFNLEKEKPELLQTLASVSVAATNLTNSLKHINREKERPSENRDVMSKFETCKTLRRSILRYIQLVESEQYLGSLIHANEELVDALALFMQLDKPIEEDSDSDEDWNSRSDDVTEGIHGMSISARGKQPYHHHRSPPSPPSPPSPSHQQQQDDDDDPDNPFGDSNEVEDIEGVTWKVV